MEERPTMTLPQLHALLARSEAEAPTDARRLIRLQRWAVARQIDGDRKLEALRKSLDEAAAHIQDLVGLVRDLATAVAAA